MKSGVMTANGRRYTHAVRRDDSGSDGVTRIQSGMMIAGNKMSRVALLNSNTTNVLIPVALARLDAPSSEVKLTLSRLDGE